MGGVTIVDVGGGTSVGGGAVVAVAGGLRVAVGRITGVALAVQTEVGVFAMGATLGTFRSFPTCKVVVPRQLARCNSAMVDR